MFTHDTQIRIRYAETDQMGYVYYGNYGTFFEVARVEAMRSLGYSYKQMEESGIMMPVLEYRSKYIRPARYDDLITVKTKIAKLPGIRIFFEYEIYNEENTLLNIAETTLVFVDSVTGKPCQAPATLLNLLKPFYENEV